MGSEILNPTLVLKNFQPVKQVSSTIVTPKYFKFKSKSIMKQQFEVESQSDLKNNVSSSALATSKVKKIV